MYHLDYDGIKKMLRNTKLQATLLKLCYIYEDILSHYTGSLNSQTSAALSLAVNCYLEIEICNGKVVDRRFFLFILNIYTMFF